MLTKIADMATENEVNAVIAPSHYLTEENIDSWLRIDCHCLIELRNMLEIRGGGVAVDCSVIISHTLLRDSVIRGKILDGIKGLPFSICGFGEQVLELIVLQQV